MDIKTKKLTLKDVDVLDYWKEIPLEDLGALRLYQKVENSFSEFLSILNSIDTYPEEPIKLYYSYAWSVSIRDFSILLRDSLLAAVKYEQFKKDEKKINPDVLEDIQSLIQRAAVDIDKRAKSDHIPETNLNEWQFQKSPISEVDLQLKELQKQCKKIYRSNSKIDDLRVNIGEYIRDFQLQYSIQISAIDNLFSIEEEVKDLSKSISNETKEANLHDVVDQIANRIQSVELIQSTESIDILPYPDRETLIIPVSTEQGKLKYKSINVKSEFARWFSSFIYPKIIELESKRDHALEKCLLAFRQIQGKIAAIQFADSNHSNEIQKEFDSIYRLLDKDVLEALRKEEVENNTLVNNHISNYLKASNVYAKDMLFLPESGISQISNLSKDAQKRLVTRIEKYRKEIKTYVNRILSRYIEVDQTSYSQFIKNKLSLNDEDDSLALFLKNGYLGKSFTVPRPEIINPILDDYRLWNEGYTGSVLLSGLSGIGKSTVLGMLNHMGLNEEIIQLKMGESYFIQHRAYDPIYDLKELIEIILKKTMARQIVICIDDLEQWHDESHDLYDNITNLFNSIVKHQKRVFFVVTCSTFLKSRLQIFKDLKPIFSSQIEMRNMSSNQLKVALNLRARVKEIDYGKDVRLESRVGNIVRESKGNPGFAMLEQCRMHNDNYKSNVKSQEFSELVKSYKTLLTYISAYHHCSIRFLSTTLSDIDFKDTKRSIDHLVSQKILIRPKKGYISINPLLIHTIENVLLKEKK